MGAHMTTDNDSLFVCNYKQGAHNEDLSHLGNVFGDLTSDQAQLLALEDLGSDLYNQLVTCNPKYEIFPVRAHKTANLS